MILLVIQKKCTEDLSSIDVSSGFRFLSENTSFESHVVSGIVFLAFVELGTELLGAKSIHTVKT